MLSKNRVLERLQTLADIVDEKYDSCSVKNAQELERIIEEAFCLVCRRSKK